MAFVLGRFFEPVDFVASVDKKSPNLRSGFVVFKWIRATIVATWLSYN